MEAVRRYYRINIGGFMKNARVLVAVFGVVFATPLLASNTLAVINDGIRQKDGDFSFAVSPPSIEFDLTPGATSSDTIRVRNTGQKETELKIGIAPMTVIGEHYNTDYSKNTPRTEITRWTKVELEPGCETFKTDNEGNLYVRMRIQEECFVKFSTETPKNAPFGSQHMSIFFEEYAEAGKEGVSMIRSIGASLYGANRTGGTGNDACGKVGSQNIPFWIFGGPLNTKATVENCGVLDFHATVEIEIRNLFGSVVYEDKGQPVDKIIMAETTRAIDDSWNDTAIGIYKTKQTVRFLGEYKTMEKWTFIVPAWLIMVILLCIAAIVLSIIHGRKKKKQASGRSRR
jgi:hypothetical protein